MCQVPGQPPLSLPCQTVEYVEVEDGVTGAVDEACMKFTQSASLHLGEVITSKQRCPNVSKYAFLRICNTLFLFIVACACC